VVTKYNFLKGNGTENVYSDILVTIDDKHTSYSTFKNCVAVFRAGHLNTENEHSVRPFQVTVPENMEALHSMILDDWTLSAKMTAETLMLSRERVGYIIHDILDMRKLSAKLFPKYINGVQKHY
jgi:hypothetical protein